ncbi:hypothetical protein MKX47_20335 [Solibacillus sp. FSL R7-0668]|uniref:hypothetical protein n=1 Tax=Solibacillus sp. FSL R7-0668 TaxID=2921688 RepID=UPI0030F88752
MKLVSITGSTLLLVILVCGFISQTLVSKQLYIVATGSVLLAVLTLLLNQRKSSIVNSLVRFILLSALIITSAQFIYTWWPYENFLKAELVAYGFAAVLFCLSVFLQLTWIRLERAHKTKRTNSRLHTQKKKRPKRGELNLILGQSVERK